MTWRGERARARDRVGAASSTHGVALDLQRRANGDPPRELLLRRTGGVDVILLDFGCVRYLEARVRGRVESAR
jgi:hypothetical protein